MWTRAATAARTRHACRSSRDLSTSLWAIGDNRPAHSSTALQEFPQSARDDARGLCLRTTPAARTPPARGSARSRDICALTLSTL